MSNERFLAGRCALITGSTAGIGLVTADALGALGADIVINGFGEPTALAKLCSDIAERHRVRVLHHGADISRLNEIGALIQAAQAHGGGNLDILVNNAGIVVDSAIEQTDPAMWEKQLTHNLSSAFHTIRLALPRMRANNWGRIVNVASVAGLVGMPERAGYVVSKHGLLGLTKVVALETASTAITCNAVCPGIVATERVLDKHKEKARVTGRPTDDVIREVMASRQASGNYIAPADVAGAIAFLCGPYANEIRGIALPLDGAWTAR